MYTFLVLVAICQVPPSPMPYVEPMETLAPPSDTQGKKEWLYAQLIVDMGFDSKAIAQLEEKLNNMSPTQIGVLVQIYRQKRAEQQDQKRLREALVLNQAQLNLQKAQAYRDHLKREYGASLLVKKQELELTRTAQQYLFQSQYGGYGRVYSGYGGYGHGYGGYGRGYIGGPYRVTPYGLRRW